MSSFSYWSILFIHYAIWSIDFYVEGYQNDGKWMACPEGYELQNSMCYKKDMCQQGYFLHTDGLCYLKNPQPCPYVPLEVPTTTTPEPSTTTTTTTTTTEEHTTTEEPTTTTEEPPFEAPYELARCPPGSIFFNEQCRKIICTQGEYYAGRCLSPACPRGTVWRDKRCQPPGYITTILEIDNVVKNKHENRAVTENVHRVQYVTDKPYDPDRDTSSDISTSPPAQLVLPTSTPAYSGARPPSGCCLVKSPRFCRPYSPKWVCFNRTHKLCDPRICTHPVIYLKPPELVELIEPPMLVMPPNPPLSSCMTPDCRESEMLNCSGCALGQRESCSAGCYNYFCPGNSCQFKKSEDFCALYPGGFGCNKNDGCIWQWCDKKYY